MNSLEINETIKAANLYLTRLKYLNNELECALKQVEHTYEDTETAIRKTFNKLRQVFTNILCKRENVLLEKAKRTNLEAIAPLGECHVLIMEKIKSTVKLISTATSLTDSRAEMKEFSRNASLLGSLPEVPELKDVPFLSFYYEPSLEIEIINKMASLGDVYKIPPVQISDLTEKPGAILVEWKVVVDYEEKVTDIEEFRLQKAFGDVTKDKHLVVNFHDCYKGLDTQFLVKDLQDCQPYSFRVCCRFEGTSEWSPWSLPQIGNTTQKHFTWKYNSNFVYSNEYKVAQPTGNQEEMLYSDGAQISIGHSVDFMFLEGDSSYAVVGLLHSLSNKLPKTVKEAKDGTFLMNNFGKIIVDGIEKSTVLPEFHRGSKVTFTCTLANDRNVRVSIDCEDKRVTYDWPISSVANMYFVAQFYSSKWKVMVE